MTSKALPFVRSVWESFRVNSGLEPRYPAMLNCIPSVLLTTLFRLLDNVRSTTRIQQSPDIEKQCLTYTYFDDLVTCHSGKTRRCQLRARYQEGAHCMSFPLHVKHPFLTARSEPPQHPPRWHLGMYDRSWRLVGCGIAWPVCHRRLDRSRWYVRWHGRIRACAMLMGFAK
jgi:hypothetical protein